MRIIQAVLSPVLAASLLLAPMQASAGQDPIGESKNTVKHVLLISVDGLHALDLSNYVTTHHDSTLGAALHQWSYLHERFHFDAVGFFSRPRCACHWRTPPQPASGTT